MAPLIIAGIATAIAAGSFFVLYILPAMLIIRDGELSTEPPEENE